MAEFVRAQIFGTTFEITSRYSDLQPVGMGAFGLVWYGCSLEVAYASTMLTIRAHSSAKDQLTNQNVAIKKIMKPFSTPVLAKRTYRELKLLKHLKHENVSPPDYLVCRAQLLTRPSTGHLAQRHIYFPAGGYVGGSMTQPPVVLADPLVPATSSRSY